MFINNYINFYDSVCKSYIVLRVDNFQININDIKILNINCLLVYFITLRKKSFAIIDV